MVDIQKQYFESNAREAGMSEAQSSIAATTMEDISVIINPKEEMVLESEATIGPQAGSSRSETTSFASAVTETDGGELEVPDLTDLVVHGTRLEYDELFECPFCGRFDTVGTRHEWRRHVFDDLQPYVCSFQDCSAGLFATRHEWFSHELDLHRTRWNCQLCESSFTYRDVLFEHFCAEHQSTTSETQISEIIALARPFREFPVGSCHLCDDWIPASGEEGDSLTFCKHLGRHLQQLALQAIPLSLEGVEILPREPDLSDVDPDWERRLAQALDRNREELGDDHPDTLECMACMVWENIKRDQGPRTRWMAVEVYGRRKAVLGEEHRATLKSMYMLSRVYLQLGEPKRAGSLIIETLDRRKRVLGEDDPDTLESIHEMVLLYLRQTPSLLEQAESLATRTYETNHRVFGEHHHRTTVSAKLVAWVHVKQHRWEDAARWQEKALDTITKAQGETHPETLHTMAFLAECYGALERFSEAEALATKALEARKTILGEEHQDTLKSMATLAVVWWVWGRRNEAIALMEKCRDMRRRRLGGNHRHTLKSQMYLDDWRQAREQTDAGG
ncbi:hypothetical protein QBC40DRAFT_270261 [Triangularia verruculosa]|uniref:C2H2-type domain-containing protein n=1 Tax=Triangularia verruculosa TaxID=2587418 RepID=A0AAN6X5E7_9PEZI|nr:hypothetical protein QBC40DRAFT_270261 [Triangularia verruculosa]